MRRAGWFGHRPWVLTVAGLLIAVIGYFGLVQVLKAMPPRYVAMLPEPVQALAREPHPDMLPTPSGLVQRHSFVPWPTTTPLATSTQPAPTSPPQVAVILPTDEPVLAPTLPPTAVPSATPAPVAASVRLDGIRLTLQTWNNCGPANMTMELSYFGWPGDQAQAASFLKPDKEDKNVSPPEMVSFARSVGFRAEFRVNGTLERLKQFLNAEIPIIAETGYDPDPQKLGWMGHYRTVFGYDDAAGQIWAHDSYRPEGDVGNGLPDSYANFDKFWRHFNRAYIVVYRPEQAETVQAILGPDADTTTMYNGALARAQTEASANPQDAFAWFNAGSSLVGLGRYDEAAASFDQARLVGLPWRMLWYQFDLYEAYYRVQRYDDILSLAATVLRPAPNLEESLYYQGLAQQAKGQTDQARASFQAALRYNPNFTAASQALAKLSN